MDGKVWNCRVHPSRIDEAGRLTDEKICADIAAYQALFHDPDLAGMVSFTLICVPFARKAWKGHQGV